MQKALNCVNYDTDDIEEPAEFTSEQEEAHNKFFDDNIDNFLVVPGREKYDNGDLLKFLWDDFEQLKVSIPTGERDKYYWYTLVDCEEGEAWIIEGYHFVNRIGYYIAKNKIEIPETGIRYW